MFKQLNEKLEKFLEMSPNFTKKDTNLPVLIFVSGRGGASHGPRIKFLNKYSTKWTDKDAISVSIEDNPRIVYPKNGVKLNIKTKEFKQVCQWIVQNKQVLLDYWFDKISLDKLQANLSPLEVE